MKKTFRSVLTMLLVFAMLLGVMAPTVLAADLGNDEGVAAASTADTLDTGWCVVSYDTATADLTVTLRPDVDAFKSVSKEQLKDLAKQVLEGMKAIALDQLKDDIEIGEGKEIANKDLIDYVTEVYVDGIQVFGPFGENGDNTIKSSAIKDLLKDIPTLSEIAEMSNDEMYLSYDFKVVTEYGAYEFTLTGVVGGGYEKIRKIAQIAADHLDISVVNGVYTVDVTVPEVFHKAVLKACKTNLISDELKLKVFKACSTTVEEFEVYYRDFTFAELIELLEAVDFEGVRDSDYIKKYVDLSNLSNEQIIEKVKEYEYYFNKAKDLSIRVLNRIPMPDRLANLTLMDLYEGDGVFGHEGSYTVDIEEQLSKVSEKYGPLVASFIDKKVVSASVDLNVSFEKIKRIQYTDLNGNVIGEGFLPAGIEYEYIEFFAPVTQLDGKTVVAWVDENGNAVTEMPDRDTVLTAVVDEDFTLTVSADVEKEYDGAPALVKVVGNTVGASYTYQWYRVDANGDIPLGTSDSFEVISVADSGEYYCVVTVTKGVITKTVTSDVVTVNITKKVISASDVIWSTPTEFDYDGSKYGVYAYGIDNVEFVYEGNENTEAGSYTAKIIGINYLNGFDTANCEVDSAVIGMTKDWSIAPKTVNVSGAEWDYTAPIKHDGAAHTVALKDGTYPTEGVTLTYGGTVTATEVGKYTATATFTAINGNYVVEGSVADLVDWEIYAGILSVDVSGLKWNVDDSFGSFLYDPAATELRPTLVSVPVGLTANYTYETGITVGSYKASVSFTPDEGYAVEGSVADLTWEITPVVINLDELTWSDLEFTYDGTEKKPTLNVPAKYEGLITVTVVGQTNAGAYKTGASYTLTDSANYTVSGAIAELDWSIAKAVIDLSGADWIDESFVYNGNAQAPVLNLPTGLPDFVKVAYTYYKDGNEVESAINAGTYTAKVVISLDLTVAGVEDNYELRLPTEAIPDVTFEIAKADYDMSGITFDGLTVDYNGQLQSVYISGQLPEFITVSYTGNNVKYIGTYTVTASFTVNSENYNDNIDPMTATITINFVAKTEHVFEDDKGIVVQVNSTKVPADNDFVVNNNTHLYTNVTLPDGREGVVVVAYDIYFAKEGTHQPIEDDFKVKIRIPEGYRTGKTLTVVYITADGEVEEMEATVEGDYAVFDTTHFSVYGIVSLGDTIAPTPVKDTDLTWIWIILALIIILLLIVIIILLIKRRKDDDDGEPTDDEPVVAPEGEPEAEEATEEAAEEEPAPVEEEPAPAEEEPAPVEEEPAPVEEEPAPAPAEEEPAPVEEEPAPAPAEEEPAPAPVVIPLGEPDEDGTRSAIVDGVVVYVRYRSSFESRLIQSDTEIQDYYTIIKNTLLSYKGVKARGSWNFESFNKGRVQCAKINVKGRALLVYLALDPKEYSESKYHFTDASDKPKFESVPMLLKVKSDRSLKYALELIEEMMNKLEIPQGDVPGTDYHMPYETTEELAKRGLVKVILPAGMKLDENSNIVRVDVGELLDGYEAKEKPAPAEEPAPAPAEEEPAPAPAEEEPAPAPVEEEPAPAAPVEEEPAPAPVEEPVHVDAVTADELLTDEEAESQIEVVHTTVKHTGKLVEINVDTICENFEDG